MATSIQTHKSAILNQHQIPYAYHGLAVINAFALGKVVLVARALRPYTVFMWNVGNQGIFVGFDI